MHSDSWVLAFDASCGQCRQISGVVAEASKGRLEVLPLADPQVTQWREQALGEGARWAPTLINVQGSRVRAWTGISMGLRLARRLGIRPTIRVVQALGDQREAVKRQAGGMGRARFLRLMGGVGVAAGLVLAGKSPALAASAREVADEWVKANAGRLPERYAEFSRYSLAYRQSIFAAVSSKVKGSLWVEHLRQYRRDHPGLTPEQSDVINRAIALLGAESTFAPTLGDHTERQIKELGEIAVAAFGRVEARALIATLGPVETPDSAEYTCECCSYDDWCVFGDCVYRLGNCTGWPTGCGIGLIHACNGKCS
ncbi:bacteriocin fulvocin C-related protein [Planotetraspora sp. GP83]|uniref:bacteriocin fulvocin C-related protein n=1 Tax=Planotetraspora sp. GP83 TaxID=3156264 RepID=UPI003518563F